MRIAFITKEYVTSTAFTGGLANYLHRVSKALVAQGYDVHIFLLHQPPTEVVIHDGIWIHTVPTPLYSRGFSNILARLDRAINRRLLDPIRLGGIWFRDSRTNLFDSLLACRKVAAVHKSSPFDLIQCPSMLRCGYFLPFLMPDVPFLIRVSTCESLCRIYDQVPDSPDILLNEWLETKQLQRARFVFAPSENTATLLSAMSKNYDIDVIRTPFFDESEDWDNSVYQQYLQDKSYILYFGRLRLLKGIHILVGALPAFLEANPDAHMVFVGQDSVFPNYGSLVEYTRRQLKDFANRVHIFKPLPHAQLYPIVANAKFSVMPSLIDNLPNAALESLALGTPVLGTFDTSLDELIQDNHNGFLVPPNNVEALQEKLITIWHDSEWEYLSKNAKHSILRFAPETTIAELLAYYQKVIDTHILNLEK